MRICITGPIATADLAPWLDGQGHGMPPGYGGAPLTAVLIGELLRRGHEVVAITSSATRSAHRAGVAEARGPGLRLLICPSRARAWRPEGGLPGRVLDLFRWERRRLASLIAASGADVVHAHWSYEFAWAAQDSGLPCVVTCHDSPRMVLRFTRSPYRALRYLMARRVLGRARCVTAVSDYMAREARRLTSAPVTVVGNPVAPFVLEAGRQRTGAGRRVAMVCNGWGDHKNPQPALKAFAAFRAQEPSAELHCFGNDFGHGQVAQRWARDAGLAEGVLFHGPMPHRQLVQALSDCDALLHPSLQESFGVVVAEAMALGLPVVGGERSGAVAWVLGMDGQAGVEAIGPGVLVDVSQPSAIAQALHQVFDHRYPARVEAGLCAARRRFQVEAVVAEYLTVYDTAMALGESARAT